MTNTITEAPVLHPIEHRFLERACVSVSPYSNVAPSTPGSYLLGLAKRGLMRCAEAERDIYGNHWSTYIVTAEGRAAYLSYARTAVPITD